MDDPIAAIKERVSIVDLVGRSKLTVLGNGRVRRTKEHPSLALYTDENTWWWFSQNAGGDIFDWWQRDNRCDFRQALEDLAHLAGVELRPRTPEDVRAADDERKRAQILQVASTAYHQILMHHPAARAARDYCHGRGWTDETLQAHRIGYVLPASVRDDTPVHEQAPLSAQLHALKLLEQPMAKAVLSIPQDTLVYPHLVGGQAVYLSGRGVGHKRHYNLPAELAGPKRLFRAEPPLQEDEARQEAVKKASGVTVLVEGQADALSLAQWGFRAVALCGIEPNATLHPADGNALQGISHVALDNDHAGQSKALDVAWKIDPMRRMVVWPTAYVNERTEKSIPVKDANELLTAGANEVEIGNMLDCAPPALLVRARLAKRSHREERSAHIEAIGTAWRNLGELEQADLGVEIAREMGVGLSQFRRLMSAAADKAKASGEEKPSPEVYENSAGGAAGGLVWEQCVRWDDAGMPTCTFAVRGKDGKLDMRLAVDVGGTAFIPFPATIDLIRKRVVLFPSEPLEYGNQRKLLGEIRSFIHRWLDVDSFYEQLAAYYVMFTWLYDLFETLPYLRALGDYGTGKSRFLQTIGVLCYRPMFVSGASTASPIFRVIDMFRGTLVVDEADFANSDAEAEIIKIVNVGYARGGVVLRAEKDQASDTYYPSAKDVYCPKVLATRRLFQDRATESRCLTKRMSTAKPRPDIPRLLSRQFWADAERIRNMLLMYRLRSHREMDVDPALSDFSIEPRLDQVTLALKSIIDDEGMREQISTFVRAYNSTLISDRQMSVPAVVVQILAETHYRPERTLQGDVRDWSIKGLSERVKTLLETIDPDEKMSPRRLSALLSEDLGLTKRDQDPESRRARLVIDEEGLHALMSRYGVDVPA